MSDYASSVDDILGQEFLTWLWFKSDVAPDEFCTQKGETFTVSMEQRIVVQGGNGDAKETASVSGVYSPLSEARYGISMGKKVVRALLHFEKDSMNYQFVLKAEDFTLNSVKIPAVEKSTLQNEDEDALLFEKIFLFENCVEFLDTLYMAFLKIRLSKEWVEEVHVMRQWVLQKEESTLP